MLNIKQEEALRRTLNTAMCHERAARLQQHTEPNYEYFEGKADAFRAMVDLINELWDDLRLKGLEGVMTYAEIEDEERLWNEIKNAKQDEQVQKKMLEDSENIIIEDGGV